VSSRCTRLIFAQPHEGTALGRNGRMRVKGLELWRAADDAPVSVEPLTSRLQAGRCRITIPDGELPGLIAALQQMLTRTGTQAAGPAVVLADALHFWRAALSDEELEVSGADMVEWFFGTFAPAAEAALADAGARQTGHRCPDCGASAGQRGVVCGVCRRGITE